MPEVIQLSPDEVAERLNDGVVVIDCRELIEWESGHIEGAIHIPMGELQPEHAEKFADVIMVCRTGARSNISATQLMAWGGKAANLAGGLVEWVAGGHPIVDSGGDQGAVF